MLGELVSITTSDRVRLDGFVSEVEPSERSQAAIIVHGLSGNFYKSRLLKHFAAELYQRNISTALVLSLIHI